MKVYLVPMISPSKYVVRLGWSSVKPVGVLVYKLYWHCEDVCAPLMRKYPHMKDSRMSTCFISTSTSYCWRSEVWVPTKRLPGRRRDEDVLGRNCIGISNVYFAHCSACMLV